MDLTAFKLFCDLLKVVENDPQKLGFQCKLVDIRELNTRWRLAKSFQGLKLDGYKDSNTTRGYEAFLKVFLTHSALERFLEVNKIQGIPGLKTTLQAYNVQDVTAAFVQADRGQKLHKFLRDRLDQEQGKSHIKRLEQIYAGQDDNIAGISVAIRHIFAHGHLSAHAGEVSPKVYPCCHAMSDFLLDVMDQEFTRKVETYRSLLDASKPAA